MKIAVCDDDKLLTGEIDGQLQRIQQKMGISFETDIFFDGETLWEAIEKHGSYDIIYLDIEMENMDGITVERFGNRIRIPFFCLYQAMTATMNNYLK